MLHGALGKLILKEITLQGRLSAGYVQHIEPISSVTAIHMQSCAHFDAYEDSEFAPHCCHAQPIVLQGFAAWHAYARRRTSLRKAMMHLRHTTASKALSTWRERAAELAQHARQLSRAALMWSHNTQAAAFRAWAHHTAIKHTEKQIVRHPLSWLWHHSGDL